jgi:Na+/proline symporter
MINKLKPAVVGGLIAGILCVIPFVSTCCCIWAALGGFLASFMYIKSAPAPVTTGEGAIVGLMTGAIGSVIYLFIQIPLARLFGIASMEDSFRRSGVDLPLSGIALMLLSAFLVVILILVFSTIGGLVGVPVFEKRKGVQPPPPPQDFGAAPGGPYGSGL